jgi:hypothetical protein
MGCLTNDDDDSFPFTLRHDVLPLHVNMRSALYQQENGRNLLLQ